MFLIEHNATVAKGSVVSPAAFPGSLEEESHI